MKIKNNQISTHTIELHTSETKVLLWMYTKNYLHSLLVEMLTGPVIWENNRYSLEKLGTEFTYDPKFYFLVPSARALKRLLSLLCSL